MPSLWSVTSEQSEPCAEDFKASQASAVGDVPIRNKRGNLRLK